MTIPGPDDEFDLDIVIHDVEILDKPIVASPYTKPVEIIVDAQAWWQMNQHAREDLRYEAGGIMLGNIYIYGNDTAVRVSMAVPAREAVNNMTSIQFTYETWRQMEQERQQRAPQERLVGWYHTHPGFTAFFSPTDHFMHTHFFAQPWHIALVIDPIKGEHRFYRWDNSQLQESQDFLLQVTQWPGPQPPLNATLSLALQRSILELQGDNQKDGTADPELPLALLRLQQHIPLTPTGSSLHDLLPLIVAATGLEPEIIARMNTLLQREQLPDRLVRVSDLQLCSSNANPQEAITIGYRWLAQKVDDRTLHFHELMGTADGISLCEHLTTPFLVRDLTVDKWGNVLLLRRDQDTLFYILPPLSLHRNYSPASDQPVSRFTVQEVVIDWGKWPPARHIGKILTGGRYLYLLTKEKIYVLYNPERYIPHRFVCHSVHNASEPGWPSFKELTDWAVDWNGNLYLLSEASKEVKHYNQLRGDRGAWQSLLVDQDLKVPRSLCVGLTTLSIYDQANQLIMKYRLPDGQRQSKHALAEKVQSSGIQHIFSDGYKGLYLATHLGIYFLPG